MDKARIAVIVASLQNQDLRIRVSLDTSLGSLVALMTFLALFNALRKDMNEIVIYSLISGMLSGILLFFNMLYCFSSLRIHRIKMDGNFESECKKLADRREDVIRKSRLLYLFGAFFMFLAFALSIYSNWGVTRQ